MPKLANKVAVITGGNSGIGLATAKLFRAEGAQVAITVRNQQRVAEAQHALGDDFLIIQADAADLPSTARLFSEVHEKLGKADVLFINAGIAKVAPFDAFTEETFDEVMNINFKGAFFTIQKALPYLNDGASIVLNTSINASMGMPMTSVYAASKAALLSLIRTLSAELVSRGIRVNAVSPGPVETPLWGDKTNMPLEQRQGFIQAVQQQVPMKRFGQAEEIAKTVLFLATDDSSFVLGTELIADGGMSQL